MHWQRKLMLWIAFIFEYLWDTTQLLRYFPFSPTSCELLSFLSIFGIQHNRRCENFSVAVVVNCFHFWVSLGYNTTTSSHSLSQTVLWIAFIFEYLWDTTQLKANWTTTDTRCELLSFLSIFGIQHNTFNISNYFFCVVNCFHFWVSLGYNTTSQIQVATVWKLWIAFIFEYLWDTTQLFLSGWHQSKCCELLSFLSIFGIQHNIAGALAKEIDVVNCFHFWVSLGYNTTVEIFPFFAN